ncbi:MAG TPA: response regulator transcription factor [Phycisphaerales bacterium]|nr:response regulator transcription factor [Phycisphaerales bacterium]
MPRRVLIVDDEADIADLIAYNLASAGYETRAVYNGSEALEASDSFEPHLVVLDVMMPGLNGYEVLARLRRDGRRVPVLMLTAKRGEEDELAGLLKGADDYVTKPFSMKVLEARVAAILRRGDVRGAERGEASGLLVHGPITINRETHEVTLGGGPLALTRTEFRLLCALIEGSGKVLSRRSLIQMAMGAGVTITERTVDVHVTSIRKKLGAHAGLLHTVRGVGYRMLPAETGG